MQSGSSLFTPPNAVDTDCAFCRQSDIAALILKETPSFRLIADHAPLVEGHLLIIPRRHYACYGTVPAELDAELSVLKQEVQQFLTRFYAPVIFWEHGVFRQTVFHAHLHCFPFGEEAGYKLDDGLHKHLVASQDDIRAWYTAHGHYFYLEDSRHSLLFSPEMDQYVRIVREVLWPGVQTRNGGATWRSPQQRYEEGKPFIEAITTNWRLFQEQGVDHVDQSNS